MAETDHSFSIDAIRATAALQGSWNAIFNTLKRGEKSLQSYGRIGRSIAPFFESALSTFGDVYERPWPASALRCIQAGTKLSKKERKPLLERIRRTLAAMEDARSAAQAAEVRPKDLFDRRPFAARFLKLDRHLRKAFCLGSGHRGREPLVAPRLLDREFRLILAYGATRAFAIDLLAARFEVDPRHLERSLERRELLGRQPDGNLGFFFAEHARRPPGPSLSQPCAPYLTAKLAVAAERENASTAEARIRASEEVAIRFGLTIPGDFRGRDLVQRAVAECQAGAKTWARLPLMVARMETLVDVPHWPTREDLEARVAAANKSFAPLGATLLCPTSDPSMFPDSRVICRIAEDLGMEYADVDKACRQLPLDESER